MIRAPRRASIAFIILLVAAAGLALAMNLRGAATSTAEPFEKAPLALLTSLPIVFGEDFDLKSVGSPVLTALSRDFNVAPIGTTNAKELHNPLLLMAQPPAQTAENLVALDDWVRNGGRILLLADPLLEWRSSRPLGDPLRPATTFADTGLLAHWGLRLDAPDQRGPVARTIAGYSVMTVSPGSLYGSCRISADRLVAECHVGKGWAVVVADADLLDVQNLGDGAENNLRAVIGELAKLKNR